MRRENAFLKERKEIAPPRRVRARRVALRFGQDFGRQFAWRVLHRIAVLAQGDVGRLSGAAPPMSR